MSGIDIRLSRLFGGKKNLVISAVDHVVEYGDQPGLEDARQAIRNCADVDALLLPRFMLKRNWDLFAGAAPAPVVRLNWSASFYYPLDYREGFTAQCATVEEAVEAGAECVICSLFLEEQDDRRMETENVAVFAEVVRQKERLGIPLIGEAYVVEHAELSAAQLHAKVKRISRVMAELGADMVKTFFTGERFEEVVANTPVPIFTIGAEKLENDLDVLRKAHDSVSRGARGVIFGRNVFMAQDPPRLVAALNDVVNDGVDPAEAARKHGLTGAAE